MSSTTAFTVPELTPIGHLGKPHGVRGELVAYLTIELETLCSDPSCEPFYLFAEIDALPVPYQLLSYRSKGDSYLLTLAHVADRSIAEQIDRGYQHLHERLNALGAHIERRDE